MGHSAAEVQKSLKIYWMVFGALTVGTVITVAIAYLHLPHWIAILLALTVATTKGSLVALYFMHLNSEKKIIYNTLALTGVLLIFLMAITIFIHGHG